MVVFGATGDLTMRKLVPALYNLEKAGLLPQEFAVLGVAIDDLSLEDFRKKATRFLQAEDHGSEAWDRFQQSLHYQRGDFGDEATYAKLGERWPLSTSSTAPARTISSTWRRRPSSSARSFSISDDRVLSKQEDGRWRRVVIEKPFGQDLDSAMALNQNIKDVLSEKQIYRIDHYLGKETVQNIMVFRFGNGIFEPIWNRRYIDHVAITNAETVGVEMRGGYFDDAGTLRDMVPNHMMQLISLTAMEPPASFSADAVRDEQAKVLNAIQPLSSEDVLHQAIRGQYGEGVIAEGKSAGLPLRARRLARIENRNLRRHEAEHRQLAVGGRSLLFAHGKAHGQAPHRNQHSVQASAVSTVPANGRPQTPDQSAGHSNPARRRHGAWLRRENPRRSASPGIGRDELRICQVFWRRTLHRL